MRRSSESSTAWTKSARVTDQAATASIQEATPLCKTLGVRAEKYAAEEIGLTLDWARELCTTNGILHGGVIMALAVSAGDAYALLNMPKDATGTATIESKTNFLGAVRSASPRPRLPSTSAEEPSSLKPRCATPPVA